MFSFPLEMSEHSAKCCWLYELYVATIDIGSHGNGRGEKKKEKERKRKKGENLGLSFGHCQGRDRGTSVACS